MVTTPQSIDSATIATPAVALPVPQAQATVPANQKPAPTKRARAPAKKATAPAASATKPQLAKEPVARKSAVKKVAAKPVAIAPPKALVVAVVTKPAIKPLVKAVALPKFDKKPLPAKVKKERLVRDSFTIPKSEFVVLEELKQRAAVLARPVKKSELLRAGIKLLASLSNDALLSALAKVPTIKTGRPLLKK